MLLIKNFRNYQEALYLFFKLVSKKNLKACKDPAKLSGDLSYYLNYDNKLRLSKYFSRKYHQIGELLKLENKRKQKKAIEGWNVLLKVKGSLENN